MATPTDQGTAINADTDAYLVDLDKRDTDILEKIERKQGWLADNEHAIRVIKVLGALLNGDDSVKSLSDFDEIINSPLAKNYRYMLATYPFLSFDRLVKLTQSQTLFLLAQ